jgi:hypothetical protein
MRNILSLQPYTHEPAVHVRVVWNKNNNTCECDSMVQDGAIKCTTLNFDCLNIIGSKQVQFMIGMRQLLKFMLAASRLLLVANRCSS